MLDLLELTQILPKIHTKNSPRCSTGSSPIRVLTSLLLVQGDQIIVRYFPSCQIWAERHATNS